MNSINYKLLYELCNPNKDEKSISLIEAELKKNINWCELTEFLLRNKMLTSVYLFLHNNKYLDNIPRNIFEIWKNYFYLNKIKNSELLTEMQLVVKCLEELNIPYKIVKGMDFQLNFIKGFYRDFGDIDILILIEDKDKVSNIMEKLGYFQLKYNRYNLLEPYSKFEKIENILTRHELLPFVKPINNNFFCVFDFQFEFIGTKLINLKNFNKTYSDFIFHRTIELYLIFLSLHLYTDSHEFSQIEKNNDLRIYSIVEIILFCNANTSSFNIDKFFLYIKEHFELETPIFSVLKLVNNIYKNKLISKILNKSNIKTNDVFENVTFNTIIKKSNN